MTWFEFLLTIHLLAATVWLGGSFMLVIIGRHIKRTGTIQSRVDFTRISEKLGNTVFAPASVLLIVAGTLMVIDLDAYKFSQAWISLGYVGWFISFLFGVGFYAQEGKRREKIIETGGIDDSGVARSLDRVLKVATVDTTIIALVVLDMATKPGL